MPTKTSDPGINEQLQSSRLPMSTPGPSHDDEISLLDLLIVIAERKRLVLAVTLSCSAVALVISLLLPTRFSATVTILPPQQGSSLSAMLSSQLGNLGGIAALAGGSMGLKNPNDMYVAMLKSRTVEDGMVQRYNLAREYGKHFASDARKAFEDHSEVDGSGKDGLIHITVDDHDPKRAAELANGYVEQYRNLSEHLAISEAAQRRLFFERQLEQAKDNLANAEEAMKVTEQKTGIIQVDSQAMALIESAASLRAQITEKEVEIASLQTYAADQNADLLKAQQQLQALQGQLSKLGGASDLSADGLLIPKGRVPEAGLEYVRKLRDVKYYETIFDLLARQFELAKLDEAKEGSLIQVVDPAIIPDKRSFPKRTLIVIAGTLAGLLIGIFVAFFTSSMRKLTQDSDTGPKLLLLRNMLFISNSQKNP